jgi:hypothetical protein
MGIGGINPLIPNRIICVRISVTCHRITVGYLERITDVPLIHCVNTLHQQLPFGIN